MELSQRAPGLDAELVDERPARGLVRLERLGLAAAAVQRKHQPAVHALPERLLGDEHLELAHDVGVVAGGEIGVKPPLDRDEPQLLQPGERALGERLVGEVGQRRPSPQRERLAQRLGREPRVGVSGLGQQRLEPCEIDLGRVGLQHVPGLARDDPVLAELAAQAGDVHMDALGDRGRWRLAPQVVDQALGRDDLARVQQEQREQRALLRSAEHQRASVLDHLERAKEPEIHASAPVSPTTGRGVYPSPPSRPLPPGRKLLLDRPHQRGHDQGGVMNRHNRLRRGVGL